ncbi:hypothetical protein ACWDG1_29565 [Streptomyces sp. NPDC001177]
MRVIYGLPARLTAAAAPPGLRRLGDITRAMPEQMPWALEREPIRPTGGSSRSVRRRAGGRERARGPGAARGPALRQRPDGRTGGRVAIDPKPLAGNPGFELLPAIDNRYDPGYTVRRFDALPDLPAIDRERPRAWTLGRCRGTVCGRSRAAALRRQCSWG